jgi:threonine synthase
VTRHVAGASEFARFRGAAADPSLSLDERIEIFEELIDSEVGDTDLARARNIERETGPAQLYLKFEGGNPTGTQKDRIAFAQVLDALRRGFDAISIATCGNYGRAVALAAAAAGLRAVIHIPSTYTSARLDMMRELGADIVAVDGDYERAVDVARELAATDDSVYDGNPGGDNTDLQVRAYGQIAAEIYDELRDAPAAVAVPVSNGTTLVGIWRGFVRLHRRGKTSRIPMLVAGSSHRKNPIVHSFAKGFEDYRDLHPEEVAETAINEPLVNWHSIDGEAALEAVRESEGWAAAASDAAMSRYSRFLRERQGLSVLPAATAGLVALISHHQQEPLRNDRYVAILTARKE